MTPKTYRHLQFMLNRAEARLAKRQPWATERAADKADVRALRSALKELQAPQNLEQRNAAIRADYLRGVSRGTLARRHRLSYLRIWQITHEERPSPPAASATA